MTLSALGSLRSPRAGAEPWPSPSARAGFCGVAITLAVLLLSASPALAHGEAVQEAFIRTRSVAFFDTRFSETNLTAGEELKLSGKVKVLETWPDSILPPPEFGQIGVYAAGPTFVLKNREVNGAPLSGSFKIEKGGLYAYNLTLVARRPGTWHVHPVMASKGAGGLLGPGAVARIAESPAGFSNPVTLASGERVDLENYGLGTVAGWSALQLGFGLAWFLWWARKPQLARLGRVAKGEGEGLIAPRDVKAGTALAIGVAVAIVGGYAYAGEAYPDPIRLQVDRPRIEPLAEPPPAAQVSRDGPARFTPPELLQFRLKVLNRGESVLEASRLVVGSDTFEKGDGRLTVSGGPVPPGERRTLEFALADPVLSKLIPVGEPLHAFGGLLFFEDAAGNRTWNTLDLRVIPGFR
ncbi:MAG: methane monooxygenase/ammonia monooxygenase subunit B [Halobacteria archaeon]